MGPWVFLDSPRPVERRRHVRQPPLDRSRVDNGPARPGARMPSSACFVGKNRADGGIRAPRNGFKNFAQERAFVVTTSQPCGTSPPLELVTVGAAI